MNFKILSKPIEAHEIEWRVQSAKNGKTTIVPYIQARAVMNRFDEAFTPAGWKCSYNTWKDRGVLCSLSVKVGDEWITKQDGADDTNIEPTKGGISDSLKRAATCWGLSRGLYDYPLVQLEGELRFVPSQVKSRLNEMTRLINEGAFNQEYVLIKAGRW